MASAIDPYIFVADMIAYPGAAFSVALEVGDEAGTAVDVSSYTAAELTVAAGRTYTDVKVQLTASDYITFSGSTVTVDVPSSVTAVWSWGSSIYSLTVTDWYGERTMLARGHFVLDYSASRS